MQKIFLVRHGETEWNLEMRFQGWENIPLNEKGIREAELLAQRLKKERIAAVYSSPLSRALKTAQIIALMHGLEPSIVEGLREISFGKWEGKTFGEMDDRDKDALLRWLNNPEENLIPEGETFKQFRERVLNSYYELINDRKQEDFLIVTHGGAIKVLVASTLHIPFSYLGRLKISPGSLTSILYDDYRNPYLDLFNDTCHLQNNSYNF